MKRIMRRINYKWFIIIIGVFFITLFNIYLFRAKNNINVIQYVKCLTFGYYESKCVYLKDDIFISTSEVIDLFEIVGNMDDESKIYHLEQNNLNLYNTTNWTYNSIGSYLFFEKYDVDLRSKVKFISVDDGVPISSQWDKNGYEYPIQIAQYGLSHYSKWIELISKKQIIKPLIIFDNDMFKKNSKSLLNMNTKYIFFMNDGANLISGMVIHKNNLDRLQSLSSYANKISMYNVNNYIKLMPKILSDLPEILLKGSNWTVGSGLHFVIRNNIIGTINLVYVCGNLPNKLQNKLIFVYSIKNCNTFKLVRNLYVDIIKAVPQQLIKEYVDYKLILKNCEIMDISIFGQGKIYTFQLSNQFSFEKFIVAADWFVSNQDSNGGWPTNVTRKLYPTVKLDPGWYSSMAQGHGLSLLTRAYHSTNKEIYFDHATRGVRLFTIDSKDNGIVANFLGNKDLVWYEEYPTDPSLFILNGFIYSLFGLLDYTHTTSTRENKSEKQATTLFYNGINSLRTLLPLFDSGFGSFYDLRHLTFAVAKKSIHKKSLRKLEVPNGPNRARWEYHIVHIEQLFYLANCFTPKDEFFIETANRYLKYLKGYRSSHN